MKCIFERETELGRCDADRLCSLPGDWNGDWLAYASTTASMTKTAGMLRIEQCCYFRPSESTEDLRPQPWVKPEMTLEPALEGNDATLRMIQELHETFIARAQRELVEQSIISSVAASADPG